MLHGVSSAREAAGIPATASITATSAILPLARTAPGYHRGGCDWGAANGFVFCGIGRAERVFTATRAGNKRYT